MSRCHVGWFGHEAEGQAAEDGKRFAVLSAARTARMMPVGHTKAARLTIAPFAII
jgi:hypothetical protein